jgi:hypothetical protein
MVSRLKTVLLFMLVLSGAMWIAVRIPPVQRSIITAIEHHCRSYGLAVSIQQIDLIPPLCLRLNGIAVSQVEEPDQPMVSCEQLSLSPLLIDLPFHRLTFFRIRGQGITVDADAIERFSQKCSSGNSTSTSYAVSCRSFHLSSLYVKSHRLPNDEKAFDCSLRGKLSLSADRERGRLVLALSKNTPSFWPKRFSVDLTKHHNEYAIRSSLFLSTEGFDFPGPSLFSGDDQLDIHAACTFANDTPPSFQTLEKASGSWALSCPTTSIPLNTDYFLKRQCQARGSLSFTQTTGLWATCERAEAIVTLWRLLHESRVDDSPSTLVTASEIIRTIPISGEGEWHCSFEQGHVVGTLQIPHYTIDTIPGFLHGSFDLTTTPTAVSLKGSLDGELATPLSPLPIHCSVESTSDAESSSLAADLVASLVRASTRYELKGHERTVWTSLRCHDCSLIAPLLHHSIGGSVELSSRYVETLQKSLLSVSATVSDFVWKNQQCKSGDIRFSTEGPTETLSKLADVVDTFSDTKEKTAIAHTPRNIQKSPAPHNVSITANLMGVQWNALHLERAHLVLSCDLSNTMLRLLEARAVGSLNRLPFDCFGSGEGQSNGTHGFLTIDRLEGSIGDEPLSLDQPLRLEHTETTISACSAALRVGTEGRISVRWSRGSSALATGDISIDHLPLRHFASATGTLEASGLFDAQGHIQVTPHTSTIACHMQAQITKLGFLGSNVGGIALGGTLSVEDETATTQLCIAGTGVAEPLLIDLSIPISSQTVFPFFTFDPQASVRGTMTGDILLSQLLAGYLPDKAGFEATLGGNVSVGGTVSHPAFRGQVHLRDGRIDLLPTGEVISDIEMDGVMEDQRIRVQRVSATDGKDGRIAGQGSLEIANGTLLWEASLQCSDVEAISLDYATALADGTIKLEGSLSQMSITGSAVCKHALIDLAARFPSDIPEIEVTYCNEQPRPNDDFRVVFDLSIDASTGIEIQGRGLSALCEGHFRLNGEASRLLVDGYLRCVRGSFSLSNKELTISEGTVLLNGNLFKDSRLNVIANITLPTITAQACLKGSLEAPKLSIQSTPPRPDTEILSLLLFNKEYGEISPLQSLQLASTAMTLQQSSGPFGLVDRLKETLGIDVIDIGSTTPGVIPSSQTPTSAALDPSDTGPPPPQLQNDVSLKVGKYISEGIAVTVSRNVTSSANYVGIEAQVAPEITANAEVGDDQAGIVSIKWKKNY